MNQQIQPEHKVSIENLKVFLEEISPDDFEKAVKIVEEVKVIRKDKILDEIKRLAESIGASDEEVMEKLSGKKSRKTGNYNSISADITIDGENIITVKSAGKASDEMKGILEKLKLDSKREFIELVLKRDEKVEDYLVQES